MTFLKFVPEWKGSRTGRLQMLIFQAHFRHQKDSRFSPGPIKTACSKWFSTSFLGNPLIPSVKTPLRYLAIEAQEHFMIVFGVYSVKSKIVK